MNTKKGRAKPAPKDTDKFSFLASLARAEKDYREGRIRDIGLLKDLRTSLRDFKKGNYIEFSTIKEFHKKRRVKWQRKP